MIRTLFPFVIVVICLSIGHAQESRNAAIYYQQAFDHYAKLPASTRNRIEQAEFADQDSARADIEQLSTTLRRLSSGANLRNCNWDTDLARQGAAAGFPHLSHGQMLASAMIYRAKYRWQKNDSCGAICDLHLVLSLARHLGDKGSTGLVALNTQYRIERQLVLVLRHWIPEKKPCRQAICCLIKCALQNDPKLPNKALLLERDLLIPWARQLLTSKQLDEQQLKWRYEYFGVLLKTKGEEWIQTQLSVTAKHYTQVGKILDMSPAAFQNKFELFKRKFDGTGNPFTQGAIVECPGIAEAYWRSKRAQAEWALLLAGLDICECGQDKLLCHRDPFSKTHFKLHALAQGFELESTLQIDGKQVKLLFEFSKNN